VKGESLEALRGSDNFYRDRGQDDANVKQFKALGGRDSATREDRYLRAPLSISTFPSTDSVAALTEAARPKLLTFVPPQPVLSPMPMNPRWRHQRGKAVDQLQRGQNLRATAAGTGLGGLIDQVLGIPLL